MSMPQVPLVKLASVSIQSTRVLQSAFSAVWFLMVLEFYIVKFSKNQLTIDSELGVNLDEVVLVCGALPGRKLIDFSAVLVSHFCLVSRV